MRNQGTKVVTCMLKTAARGFRLLDRTRTTSRKIAKSALKLRKLGYPEVKLFITDGQDQTQKQVADVENLIVQQVDVLLISPKESAGLTGVVEKAIDAKIPGIVLDRNVDIKRITEFIGGDNVLIGKAAGEYAVKPLGGAGKAAGNVVEIWGGLGTSPAHDRHDGLHT
jgi:ribose transport system substrate-binding protein